MDEQEKLHRTVVTMLKNKHIIREEGLNIPDLLKQLSLKTGLDYEPINGITYYNYMTLNHVDDKSSLDEILTFISLDTIIMGKGKDTNSFQMNMLKFLITNYKRKDKSILDKMKDSESQEPIDVDELMEFGRTSR